MLRGTRFLLIGLVLMLVALAACSAAPLEPGQIQTDATATVPAPQATAVPTTDERPTGPAAVTQAFYEWYLSYIGDRASGEFRNPLVDRAYADSPYLTARYVGQVDEALATMQQGGYDPILQAQDIPERIEVQEPTPSGDSATVTVLRYWGGNPEPSPMVVHLVRQNGQWLIDNVTPFEMVPEPQTGALEPEAVVAAFYSDYVAAVGAGAARAEQNPLLDGTYRASPYLTPDFVTAVDAFVAEFGPYGFDPILLATDPPDDFTLTVRSAASNRATVIMDRTWPGVEQWLPMAIELVNVDGRWLIDHVSLVTAPGSPAPAQVVADFYSRYLAYIGSPAAGPFRSPLVDRAYAQSPHVTPDLIAAIDAKLEAQRQQPGGSDPFLCAQAVPFSVAVESSLLQPAAESAPQTAAVPVHDSFSNHVLLLTLREMDGAWLIDDITCTDTPETRAQAFYTWYIGLMSDRGGADWINPLVTGEYQDTPYLTQDLVQRVDEALAGMEQGGFDPFLMAQDVPQGFTVEPGAAPETAVVQFYFLGPENEPYGGWSVLLSFVEERGRWLIDQIEPYGAAADGGGEATAANVLGSTSYGFALSYPADWVVKELDVYGPGRPDDWPVMAAWQLMPPDVAAALEAQSGPDPNAPPIVAPFMVEVLVGDEAAVERVYGALAAGETAVYGDHSATVLRYDPGYTHTIFQHPSYPDRWIVITDWVTEFAGREAQAAAAAPVLLPLLNSLTFTE